MLVALILLVAVHAQYRRKDECPTVICSSDLETTTCGWLDYTDYSLLVRPCALGFSCEPAYTMTSKDTLQCVPKEDLFGFSYTSVMQLDLHYHKPELLAKVGQKNGVVPRTFGDVCYSDESWCSRDQGVVCHCKNQCRCVEAGQLGDRCSADVSGDFPGCAWGLGCHNEYCVPWFSVSRGLRVSDPWLCESIQTYEDGSCVPAEKSTWDITVPCTRNSECVGSAGTSADCTCGLLGRAYCPPFALDDPYTNLKSAIIAGDLQQHAYWRMMIDNWAQVQRGDGRGDWTDHPGCVGNVWPEMTTYLRSVEYHEDLLSNPADTLAVTALALLLSN